MIGNPEAGARWASWRKAAGTTPSPAGFQGQRQWTDHMPNGDFDGSDAQFQLRLERHPRGLRDGDGERYAQRRGDAASAICSPAPPPAFADVRTYWSPEAVERVTGWKPDGLAEDGFIHLINSGAAALDGQRRMRPSDGKPAHEALLGDHRGGSRQVPEGHARGAPANLRLFPRRRLLVAFHDHRAACR